jgi:integration host factor subunit alpha
MSENDKPEGTLTRRELREAAYRECTSISRADAREIVDSLFEEIGAALLSGETVKLHSFGVFKVRSKRERMGRNPKTCNDAVISARRVVSFKPAKTLVAYLNGGKGKAKSV